LSQYQAAVAPAEAPTRIATTRNGWKILATRGFGKELEIAGPIHFYYFIDSSDAVRIRESGNLYLDALYAGNVLCPGREHIVIAERGHHSADVRTRVWLLGEDGAPILVFDELGYLESISTRSSEGNPRLYLLVPGVEDFGVKRTWREKSWEWDEKSLVFRAMIETGARGKAR